jgi:hypothetical protein
VDPEIEALISVVEDLGDTDVELGVEARARHERLGACADVPA